MLVTTGIFAKQSQIELEVDGYPIVLISGRRDNGTEFPATSLKWGHLSSTLPTALDKIKNFHH